MNLRRFTDWTKTVIRKDKRGYHLLQVRGGASGISEGCPRQKIPSSEKEKNKPAANPVLASGKEGRAASGWDTSQLWTAVGKGSVAGTGHSLRRCYMAQCLPKKTPGQPACGPAPPDDSRTLLPPSGKQAPQHLVCETAAGILTPG